MLRDDPSLSAEVRERIAQTHTRPSASGRSWVDMNHLTRVQLFEHTGRGLPEMIDIRKSAGTQGAPRTSPSA